MADVTQIPGIQSLWEKTPGDSQVCVAVLDGLVDQAHACFVGANLKWLPTLVQEEVSSTGAMSLHGTHVASIIFGQHGSEIPGIAPKCRGLIVPIFSDNRSRVSQLDIARAIESAVNAGAHIINISGGQLTEIGEAEGWLEKAVQLCNDNNVLIVAVDRSCHPQPSCRHHHRQYSIKPSLCLGNDRLRLRQRSAARYLQTTDAGL